MQSELLHHRVCLRESRGVSADLLYAIQSAESCEYAFVFQNRIIDQAKRVLEPVSVNTPHRKDSETQPNFIA